MSDGKSLSLENVIFIDLTHMYCERERPSAVLAQSISSSHCTFEQLFMDVLMHRSLEKRLHCIQKVMMSDAYVYLRCLQMSSVDDGNAWELPLPPDPRTPNMSKRTWERAMMTWRSLILSLEKLEKQSVGEI